MKTFSTAKALSTTVASAALLLLLGAPACEQGDAVGNAPTILSFNIESTNVGPGVTIAMDVDAQGIGSMTYAWIARPDPDDDGADVTNVDSESVGNFSSRDQVAAIWTAPMEEGTYRVSVTVTDAAGRSTISAPILVGPGIDADEDGYAVVEGDCDDFDDTVYPGAPEVQDTIDNDCDGQIDEGAEDIDDDGDGFSDIEGDCDDGDASIYPGAPEQIDSIDENCNGLVDDGTSVYDDDGDGFSEDEGDCDDGNAGISPAATELLDTVDNDCDGVTDENTVGNDDDRDGYSELAGDCDDGNNASYPGAPELPDGRDNDCNGQIDDGAFITDDDGDGWTDLAGDCDDTNPYTYPGAPEYLDGLDNDCDLSFDEGMDTNDNDGDGYSEAAGDCNDSNNAIYPGALELDDDIDNDCDGFGYTSPPIAVATVVGDPLACGQVDVSAVNSYDPDGDTLDFAWYFSTTPSLSDLTDLDLIDRFEMNAAFLPDTGGYYSLGLTVNDNVYSSPPATVGFIVQPLPGNNAPVAQFVNSNISDFALNNANTDPYGNCTGCPPCTVNYLIDASASSDADGNPMYFDWAASKVQGSGSIDLVDNQDGTATVEVNVPVSCPASAGTQNSDNGLFEVEVLVRDCNGATSDTDLQINYTCNCQW